MNTSALLNNACVGIISPARRFFAALIALMLAGLSASHAATLTLTDLSTNSWVGNPSTNISGPYNGYEYAVGNLGNAPQHFQVLMKFNITSLEGLTLADASLNLSLYFKVFTITSSPNTVAVTAFSTNFGAEAFTAASYNQATLPVGSFQVDPSDPEGTPFSINITSALQSAIDQGFDYFALQINNVTADALPGPAYGPELVSFSSSTTLPNLQYTAVPEPASFALMVLAGAGFVLFIRLKDARRANI